MSARPGDKHHNAKMTPASVRAARKLYETGEWTITALARKFNITHQTMGSLLKRQTWRHVE